MAGSTFQTNPFDLHKLLEECHRGTIQLPDFQRSWVWDEERIRSLIASVSRAFPVGALMSLDTGGPVNFKPRPVEGAPPEAKQQQPQSLLLDGQQRMTSLYQVTLRRKVVETVVDRHVGALGVARVELARAADLLRRVLDHLGPLLYRRARGGGRENERVGPLRGGSEKGCSVNYSSKCGLSASVASISARS